MELSRLMQRCVCQATGRQDGGSHQNNLAVLRLTSMPAILLELGFISTPDEEQFMNSDSAVDLYTKGIYNAFITYKNKYDTQSTLPYQNNVIEVSVPADDNMDDEQSVIDDRRSNRAARTTVQRKSVVGRKGNSDTPRQNSNMQQKREVAAPKAASKNTSKSDKAFKADKQTKKDNDKKVVRSQAAHAPVFKIQILQGSYKLRDNDRQFKELTGIERMEDGGKWKYFYGSSTDYNVVNRSRKEILDKFPGAFIVAYKDGKQMNVNEAIKEFLSNKRKK